MQDVLRIAVCDDEKPVVEQLAGKLEAVFAGQSLPYETVQFTSGGELVERAEEFEAVFLDLDMPELNGVEVGKRILKKNRNCAIVVASGREDWFKNTYKIQTLRFISKPFLDSEVMDAVEAVLRRSVGREKLEVFCNRRSCWLRQREIRYIKAYDGYVEILADGIWYRRDLSLGEIWELLDQRCFFQIHRKYIVNLFWIDDYDKKSAFIGNEKLTISKRRRLDFEMAYRKFDAEYR